MRISIFAMMLSANFCTATAASPDIDIKDAWPSASGQFARGARVGVGFSFKYDGNPVGPQFSHDWHAAVTDETDAAVTRTTFTHESGLVVTREVRVLRDFDAFEYKLYFKNTTGKKLPAISEINTLDISFGGPVSGGNCIISSGGGLADAFLPPRSFAIRKNCLSSEHNAAMELTTEGGRSSDKDLPFFLIQNEAMRAGMFVAFGWSGQWLTRTSVDHAAQTLDVKGRIPGLNIALKPGEEIQGATVLLGLYEGTLSDGSNRLRRLIRDVYTPLLGGERFLPIATYDTWFDLGLKYDEPLLRKLADAAAEIGQEYFLLDAGWYAGTKGDWDFSAGVGNWYEIDRGRLPGGIKPIADYVRSKGLKIGMFFEPERVARESTLAKEHADWILWKHAEEPENAFNSIMRNSQFGLLDYGRPEVQQWVRSMMDHYIRDLDVRYIRYDFNIDPLPYWNANDKKDRRGMTQLRYIQGLYAIMDWLRARNPNTVFEGCATGGRRIDLETVRRFHTFWISDQTDDPAITRFHQFGINHFLPGNYHYIQYTLPSRQGFQPDDLGFQSLFGGAFGTNGRIDQWPEPLLKKTRLHVDTWKKHRRYLVEDYYPLGDQPADMESWSGWQFQDPKDQSGYIQIFRTRTPGATHRFQLRSLDERARYRFMDAYSEEEFEVSGAVAMTTGIEVTQAPMSSRVFVYRKMSPAGFE